MLQFITYFRVTCLLLVIVCFIIILCPLHCDAFYSYCCCQLLFLLFQLIYYHRKWTILIQFFFSNCRLLCVACNSLRCADLFY